MVRRPSRFINSQRLFFGGLAIVISVVAVGQQDVTQKQLSLEKPLSRLSVSEKRDLESLVNSAFSTTHQGFSADELLLNDKVRNAFVAACKRKSPSMSEFQFCWTLLNLRKAGKLSAKSTKRRASVGLDSVMPLAESAARSILDEHNISTDMMMSHPDLRRQFDDLILELNPKADLYVYRKRCFA